MSEAVVGFEQAIAIALRLPRNGGLRPWTYHCLFGLLSVSGLRLGEARNLELQDVDLRGAVLTVRSGKFGKARLLPLHPSTRDVFAHYLARRARCWAGRPVSSYVFVSNRGNRLDNSAIHRTFYALSREIGLRGPSDSHGPRLHDLRHRFAVNTLCDPEPERSVSCRSLQIVSEKRSDRWKPVKYRLAVVSLPCVDRRRIRSKAGCDLSLEEPEL